MNKKRILTLSAAAVMCLSAVSFTAYAEEEEKGLPYETIRENLISGETPTDFNLDGNFDAYDPYDIMEFYVENQTGAVILDSDEVRSFIAENGDINQDGKVDIVDTSYLLVYLEEVCPGTEERWKDICILEEFEGTETGDVNADGVIDAIDASRVLQYYADKQTSKNDENMSMRMVRLFGDINGDGRIDACDASAILAVYVENQTTR